MGAHGRLVAAPARAARSRDADREGGPVARAGELARWASSSRAAPRRASRVAKSNFGEWTVTYADVGVGEMQATMDGMTMKFKMDGKDYQTPGAGLRVEADCYGEPFETKGLDRDLYAAKQERRRRDAALAFEEKVEVVLDLQEARA